MPQGEPIPNEVAARFGLQILTYFPGRRAAELACPSLFCVCEKDSVAPSSQTLKHVSKALRGTVKTYPEGHFDIYVGQAFEHVVADQVDFLHRTVPPSPGAGPSGAQARRLRMGLQVERVLQRLVQGRASVSVSRSTRIPSKRSTRCAMQSTAPSRNCHRT